MRVRDRAIWAARDGRVVYIKEAAASEPQFGENCSVFTNTWLITACLTLLSSYVKTMGGKDTPPPCVSCSPMQSRGFPTDKSRSFSTSSAASSSFSLSSSTSSSSTSHHHQPAPIRYVAPCKTRVNLQLQCPSSPSISRPVDRGESTDAKDGSFSPIRAYIDCLTPQTLKCAIVGDSGVGKTSMLMSYVVDKFPETHSPTIYDKFSSKSDVYMAVLIGRAVPLYS